MKLKQIKTVISVALLSLGQCVFAETQTLVLGSLEHPENFDLTSYSDWIDYTVPLNWTSRTFRVRLPSDYDPNESYGLVSFINSTSDGLAPESWEPILDKYRLIWVGGDNIGNGILDLTVRRGVGILGAMRMTELYNIDTNRIYASGTSGGSRMASGLVLMRDDFFKGIIANVGFAITDSIPDDFITDFSQSNATTYENESAIGGDSQTIVRTAQQTFYHPSNQANEGEFREQENLSIYHLSMIPNGNQSKLVESPGDHYSELEYAFEEAAKWMNHPLVSVIEDTFDNSDVASNPGTGSGFVAVTNAGNVAETTISGEASGTIGVIELAADAEIRSQDTFNWNDDYGMRLSTALRSDYAGAYNQRMEMGLVPADVREEAAIKLIIEQTGATTKTASLVMVERDGIALTLCSFSFEGSDEPINRASSDRAYFRNDDNPLTYDGPGYNFRGLDIYWFMDDDKFQINFRQNIDRASFSSELSTPPVLLNDCWTVQGRWSDLGLSDSIGGMKRVDEWRVYLKNEAIAGGAADAAYVDFVEVHGAQPGQVAALDGSDSTGTRFDQQAGADQLLVFEAEDFHRQEVQGLHRWITTSDGTGYSGAGAVATFANVDTEYGSNTVSSWSARLDYGLKFITNGTYKVWVRAQAPSTADDAVWVGMNEDGTDAVNLSGFGSGSYNWVSGTIEVNDSGEAWFYLWVGEDGLMVDQILLTPNQSYTPSGAVSVPAGEVMSLFFGPPAAPAGLTALPNSGTATLAWTDNSESDVTGYNIYRSTVSGVYDQTPLVQGVVTNEYVDSSVVNDTTYYYVVTAVDTAGNESARSEEASVIPRYTINITGNTTGASGGEFADYSSLSDGNAWGDSSDDDGVVGISVSRTGFNSDVSITKWRATNYKGSGTEINYSPASATLTDASAAIAQRAFVAIKLDSTAFDSDEFTLDEISVSQWRDNSASSATRFQFAYDADGNGYDTGDLIGSPVTNTVSGTENTFVVSTALTTSYTNRHEVRLYYWDAAASWAPTHLFNIEASCSLKLPDADTTPPLAPANPAAVGEPGQISLSWDANTESDLAAAPYTLYRSATSGSGYSVIASNLADTAYTDSNVTAGETWYYVVTAKDLSGNESAYSTEVSAAAQAVVDVTVISEDFAAAPDITGVIDAGVTTNGTDNLGWYVHAAANVDNQSLNLTTFTRGAAGYRSVASAWLIDLDEAPAATYTVQFDISNFSAGAANLERENWFHVYRVSGMGTVASGNNILIDWGDNVNRTLLDVEEQMGTASVSLVDSVQITGDQTGLQADFTLDGAGTSGDVLILAWVRMLNSDTASLGSDTFSVDNLTVSARGGGDIIYDAWAYSFGGAGTIGALLDDHDGDGLSNLIEYALNLDPAAADDQSPVSLRSEGDTFTYVHAKVVDDPGLIYRLLDTTNLLSGTWNTNTYVSQTLGPEVDNYQMVTNHYSITDASMYFKLQVEAQ